VGAALGVEQDLTCFVEVREEGYLALVAGARSRLVQVVERVVGVLDLVYAGAAWDLQQVIWVLFGHRVHGHAFSTRIAPATLLDRFL
jgi:hypothetical protein